MASMTYETKTVSSPKKVDAADLEANVVVSAVLDSITSLAGVVGSDMTASDFHATNDAILSDTTATMRLTSLEKHSDEADFTNSSDSFKTADGSLADHCSLVVDSTVGAHDVREQIPVIAENLRDGKLKTSHALAQTSAKRVDEVTKSDNVKMIPNVMDSTHESPITQSGVVTNPGNVSLSANETALKQASEITTTKSTNDDVNTQSKAGQKTDLKLASATTTITGSKSQGSKIENMIKAKTAADSVKTPVAASIRHVKGSQIVDHKISDKAILTVGKSANESVAPSAASKPAVSKTAASVVASKVSAKAAVFAAANQVAAVKTVTTTAVTASVTSKSTITKKSTVSTAPTIVTANIVTAGSAMNPAGTYEKSGEALTVACSVKSSDDMQRLDARAKPRDEVMSTDFDITVDETSRKSIGTLATAPSASGSLVGNTSEVTAVSTPGDSTPLSAITCKTTSSTSASIAKESINTKQTDFKDVTSIPTKITASSSLPGQACIATTITQSNDVDIKVNLKDSITIAMTTTAPRDTTPSSSDATTSIIGATSVIPTTVSAAAVSAPATTTNGLAAVAAAISMNVAGRGGKVTAKVTPVVCVARNKSTPTTSMTTAAVPVTSFFGTSVSSTAMRPTARVTESSTRKYGSNNSPSRKTSSSPARKGATVVCAKSPAITSQPAHSSPKSIVSVVAAPGTSGGSPNRRSVASSPSRSMDPSHSPGHSGPSGPSTPLATTKHKHKVSLESTGAGNNPGVPQLVKDGSSAATKAMTAVISCTSLAKAFCTTVSTPHVAISMVSPSQSDSIVIYTSSASSQVISDKSEHISTKPQASVVVSKSSTSVSSQVTVPLTIPLVAVSATAAQSDTNLHTSNTLKPIPITDTSATIHFEKSIVSTNSNPTTSSKTRQDENQSGVKSSGGGAAPGNIINVEKMTSQQSASDKGNFKLNIIIFIFYALLIFYLCG